MSEVGNVIEALIIGRALELGASDVHIEPRGSKVNVRVRVDGVLHLADSFPAAVYDDVLSELKSLAGLNKHENRLPQTGTFRVSIDDKRYSFRMNTLPTADGEKAILGLSQINAKAPSLKQLGFWGENLAKIGDVLRLKRGMVLLAGPDDAGKSTTLFTLLSSIDNGQISIATIEDNIEHKIPGASQTAVNLNAGLTIDTGLSTITRSDSEVIMASRIPNSKTAKLLVDSALSGHLVFSSLNANNGGEAVSQLLHMDIEPYLIANTLRYVISTRLVRQLCAKCREPYRPNKTELESLCKAFDISKSSLKNVAKYESQIMKESIGVRDKKSSISGGAITRLWRAKGCKLCLGTGYSGRVGLYEIMNNSPTIERLIMGAADPSIINKQSAREGSLSLRTDGLVKALRGVTSIEEVLGKTEE